MPFELVLQSHPNSIPGLRAAFAAELQRRIDEHTEAAETARVKKKTIASGKPGAADYSPEQTMYGFDAVDVLLKSVFRLSTRTRKHLLEVAEGEEDALIELVLGHVEPYSKVDIVGRLQELETSMAAMSPHIGAFPLRFANSTHEQVFDDEVLSAGEVPPVVCSLTVPGSVGAACTANMGVTLRNIAGRLLSQPFIYRGEATCLNREITRPDSAFVCNSAYLTPELVAKLRTVQRTKYLLDGTPQVTWPVGVDSDGAVQYHSLSPVPSVAVLDSLLRQDGYVTGNSDFYVPVSQMVVGGTKPGNCGMFNSENVGKYKIFRSVLTLSQGTESRYLTRFVWAADWLQKLRPEHVEHLSKYNESSSRVTRERLVASVARTAVAVALYRAKKAAEYLDLGTTEINERLAASLQKNVVYQYLVAPSKESVAAVTSRVVGLIAEADESKSLLTSDDLRTRLTEAVRIALLQFDETPASMRTTA